MELDLVNSGRVLICFFFFLNYKGMYRLGNNKNDAFDVYELVIHSSPFSSPFSIQLAKFLELFSLLVSR